MASAPAPGPLGAQVSAVVREFAAQHYETSGAEQFGIDQAGLAEILAGVVSQSDCAAGEPGTRVFLSFTAAGRVGAGARLRRRKRPSVGGFP